MSAHTPTNLIRSFRCSAQEGFCAATVSRGSPALERQTRYGFIYLEGQPAAQRTFSGQHLENFEVILDFGLSRFFPPRCVCLSVCVCEVSLAKAAQTHPPSVRGGGGGGE